MAAQASMVMIRGTRFGDLQAEEAALYELVAPLAGFPGTRRLMVHALAGQAPFVWLQSVEEPSVAFPALDPAAWFEDWALGLSAPDAAALGAEAGGEVRALCLASLSGKATVNLAAPVVLCPGTRRAMQAVDAHLDYPLEQPLFG